MGKDFRHGSILQQRVLHLVIEAAMPKRTKPYKSQSRQISTKEPYIAQLQYMNMDERYYGLSREVYFRRLRQIPIK